MKEIYKDAFSEVDAILSIMPSTLLSKIPLKLKQLITEYKNINYRPLIEEPIENHELKDETKIILSLIYRDFLCSNEEKEKLKIRDAQKLKEEEEKLREKYNPDTIFKNKKIETIEDKSNTVAIIEYKEPLFKRIVNKTKSIFNIK